MRRLSLLLTIAAATGAAAQAPSAPVAEGDPAQGAAMTRKDCDGCHKPFWGSDEPPPFPE